MVCQCLNHVCWLLMHYTLFHGAKHEQRVVISYHLCNFTDTLSQEMEARFAPSDTDRCELLLLIPSCLTSPKWRGKENELLRRVEKAADLYKKDMGENPDRFQTELHLWRDYW